MANVFLAEQNGSKCVSNMHVKLGTQEAAPVEVTDLQKQKVLAGTHDLTVQNEKASVTKKPDPPKPEKVIAKENLKKKIEDGTATDDDIKEALKLLL